MNPGRSQSLAAFIRREAYKLFPNSAPGDPTMHMTLMLDGNLPPRPYRFSGWLTPWMDLRDTNAHWPIAQHLERRLRGPSMAEMLERAEAERIAKQAETKA